jgi:hypothetical protein
VERRTFLKLGALSIPALGGGWAAAAIRSLGSQAVAAPPGGADAGVWGSLVDLVDGTGSSAYGVHGVLLSTGQVLMAGGAGHRYNEFLLDPAHLSSTTAVTAMELPTDQPRDYLLCGGNAPLADGRVLFAGGSRPGDEVLPYSMLFDPTDGSWTRIRPNMAGGRRWYATVTRLPDGRMLVTGGFYDFGLRPNRSVEVFDPERHDAGKNPWKELISNAGNPWPIEPTGEDYTHVFLLPRPVRVAGRERQIVMVGKTGVLHFVDYTGPATLGATRFAVRPRSRRPGSLRPFPGIAMSSVLLPDGRIMLVGGSSDPRLQQRADIYDPQRDTWDVIDTGIRRVWPAAMLLPDGRVLVANGEGGEGIGTPARAPQIIDPVARTVHTGPPWPDSHDRGYHNVALLLPDGSLLTVGGAGGRNGTPNNERTDLRVYLPGYLHGGDPRPEIAVAPAVMRYGAPFPIRFVNGPVHRVTMIALAAMTHAFDENQRFVELFDGLSSSGELIVAGPRDGAVGPPGDYLLFLLRRTEQGEVPSTGLMVRLLPS